MPFFVKPLSISELKRSNVLVTGLNQTGKTRLVMGITEHVRHLGLNENFRVIVFDVVGHWKKISSIPFFVEIRKLKRVKIPEHSIIFDISFLIPDEQKQFIESALLNLWNSSLDQPLDRWTLCIFEESQLYCRYLRGKVSQQIMRIFSVGANLKIRSLAIAPTLTGLDAEFIRLCNQRYHFRLGNEQNIKRKFKSYYGKDWLRVALQLDVGFFIYYLNGKLEVKHVSLYESETQPKQLHLKRPQKTINHRIEKHKKSLGYRFAKWIDPDFDKEVLTRIKQKARPKYVRNLEEQENNDLEAEEDFILIIEEENL